MKGDAESTVAGIVIDDFLSRRLIELLKTSKDPLVLAVAASDIAYYIKFCDVGKKCVSLPPSFPLSRHSEPQLTR